MHMFLKTREDAKFHQTAAESSFVFSYYVRAIWTYLNADTQLSLPLKWAWNIND